RPLYRIPDSPSEPHIASYTDPRLSVRSVIYARCEGAQRIVTAPQEMAHELSPARPWRRRGVDGGRCAWTSHGLRRSMGRSGDGPFSPPEAQGAPGDEGNDDRAARVSREQ